MKWRMKFVLMAAVAFLTVQGRLGAQTASAGNLEQRQRIVGTTELRFTPENSGLWEFRTVDNGSSDPFLRVYNSDRELIGRDNDSGSDLNAVLTVYLFGGKEYIISAEFHSGGGQYYLEAKELLPAPTVELLCDRTAIDGITFFSFAPPSSGLWRLFTADKYSDADPLLLLFDSSGNLIARDTHSAGNHNARIFASLAEGEIYYILASFCEGVPGSYTLHLETLDEIKQNWMKNWM